VFTLEPAQVLLVIPRTATISDLRGNMLQRAQPGQMMTPLTIVMGWFMAQFAAPLRIFR
jgi:hypothetical protein